MDNTDLIERTFRVTSTRSTDITLRLAPDVPIASVDDVFNYGEIIEEETDSENFDCLVGEFIDGNLIEIIEINAEPHVCDALCNDKSGCPNVEAQA